jgi:hypothetical protein
LVHFRWRPGGSFRVTGLRVGETVAARKGAYLRLESWRLVR